MLLLCTGCVKEIVDVANMEAGGGAGSGARVSEDVIVYTLGEEP